MVYSTENFYKTFECVRRRIPYKICIKGIDREEILLRSDIKDLNETSVFVEAYQAVTHSCFKILNKSTLNSPICRRKWICDHSAVSGINETCPASINILIKKMNKQNTVKDAFLRRNPPHPAVIRINPNHNHPLMIPVAPCKLFKVNNDVKSCFYEYFKRGYYGAKAKLLHEQYLQRANFFNFGDESMNPSLPVIFTLYKNWQKMKGGSSQLDTDNRIARSLQSSNIQKDRNNEIAQSTSQDIGDFINVEDLISKLKKEPEDEYTVTENIINDDVEDVKPILNIKQESIDASEDDALPIIASYGSVASVPSTSTTKPVSTIKADSKSEKMVMQNAAAVAKIVQPPLSQYVVYHQASNTYKIVKYLTIRAGPYSASQYKSDLPNALLPTRLSLQKL